MKSFFEITKDYKILEKPRKGNPITDLIQEFVVECNKEAGETYMIGEIKKKSRVYSFGEVRAKLNHLNEESLRTFLSQCRDYRNRNGSFRKCFLGCLKIK